jgi:putative FmdB family regulatory protein
MPTYDYACAACGHRFEVVHGVHGHGPETCPSCGGGPVRKAFAPPTVLFKGSGWAKVDRRASSAGKKRDSGEEASKPDTPKTEPAASGTGGTETTSTAGTQTD